ncbi:MAG: DUF2917 domain-containing protein [Deferribacterales bacterium]
MNEGSDMTFKSERELKRFQVLSIVKQKYTTIQCYKGSLWLTAGADFDDIVLKSGQHITLVNHGHIVVEALEDASVMFAHTAPACETQQEPALV